MFENKKKFALWVYPDTLETVSELYRGDNCESKSEFIEKAIRFYAGYLTAEDKSAFLPTVVTSTLKSIVAESDNRQSRLLFKLAVELLWLVHKTRMPLFSFWFFLSILYLSTRYVCSPVTLL